MSKKVIGPNENRKLLTPEKKNVQENTLKSESKYNKAQLAWL